MGGRTAAPGQVGGTGNRTAWDRPAGPRARIHDLCSIDSSSNLAGTELITLVGTRAHVAHFVARCLSMELCGDGQRWRRPTWRGADAFEHREGHTSDDETDHITQIRTAERARDRPDE